MKKFKSLLLLLLMFIALPFNYASAEEPQYLNISRTDLLESSILAQQQDVSRISISKYRDNPLATVYSGIGRVMYDKMPAGTGFVIGDYTFLTNAHVVDSPDATKRFQPMDTTKMTFQPGFQNGKGKYNFHIEKIIFVSGTDIAIVHTKEKMTSTDVRTMKLATEEEINNMKTGDRIHIAGYPNQNKMDDYNELYWSKGIYLQSVINTGMPESTVTSTVAVSRGLTSEGSSGSPVMNSDYKVIGVHSIGFDRTDVAKYDIIGSASISGYNRTVIDKYIK